MGDMTGPVTKTTPPQVQVSNVLCGMEYLEDYALKLADGSTRTSNFVKVTTNSPIMKFKMPDGTTPKTSITYYDLGDPGYCYDTPQGLVKAPIISTSILFGDKTPPIDFTLGWINPPNIGNGLLYFRAASYNKNLTVDGVPTNGVYLVNSNSNQLAAGVQVGDLYYIDANGYPVKAKNKSIFYSDNPATGVAEPPVIDITMPIEKSILASPIPANEQVNLKFVLSKNGLVSFIVLNSLGMDVQTSLSPQKLSVGEQQVTLDTSKLPPGLYFVRIESPGERKIGSFVVER